MTALPAPEQAPVGHDFDGVDPSLAASERLRRLAAALCGTASARVVLIEPEPLGVPHGLASAPSATTTDTRRVSQVICQQIIESGAPLVVDDARAHPLVRPQLVNHALDGLAYLGVPLRTTEGRVIGALCVMDLQRRQWQPEQVSLLEDLAALGMREVQSAVPAQRVALEALQLQAHPRAGVQDAMGMTPGLVTSNRTRSGHEEVEDQLRESEERLRFVLEAAQVGYWDLDVIRNTTVRSVFHDQLFGYHELLPVWTYDSFLAHIHPQDREQVNRRFQDAQAGKGHYNVEFRVVWADQSVHWLVSIGQFFRNAAGQAVRISGVVLEVSERKQQEASLRTLMQHNEQQSRLVNTMLSFISDFTYIFDHEGRFVYANQALLNLWGLTLDQVVGATFFDLPYPEDQATRLECQIQQVIKTKQGLTDQIPYTSLTGEEGFYEYIFQPVVAADGTVDRVVGSTRNVTAHRRTVVAEREARRFWQATLDALASHIAVLDQHGTIIAVNTAWQQFAEDNAGAPQCCGIGANYLQVCTGASVASDADATDAMEATNGIRAVIAGARQVFTLEYPCHSPAEQRWFNLRVTRFAGAGPVHVVVAHENITARKQAEEALRASEARYRTLVEHFPNGAVFLFDRDLRYVVAGGTGLAASGLSAEMIVGKTIHDLYPPDIAARDALILRAALRGVTTTAEVAFGEQVFLVQTLPVTADGAIVGGLVMTQDVTEQQHAAATLRQAQAQLEQRVQDRTRDLTQANVALGAEIHERQQAETALRASEQRFRSLLDLAPEGIALFDGDGYCVQANQRAADLLGYTLTVLPGMSLRAFMLEDDWHDIVTRRADRELGASTTRERWLVRQDGTTFRAEISSAILPGAMMQSIFRDITARMAADDQLRQAKTEAERANAAKSEFLSRLSHELRTPLNAILGFGQILHTDTLTALQHESVGYILGGGRHLLRLINEVLDITRVEAGRLELSIEPMALADIVPDTCALLGPLAVERTIRIDHDLTGVGTSLVLADRQCLTQVLLNLIGNAIKYNDPGGHVAVTCRVRPNARIQIAVHDTGPGIAPDALLKLFTPFERASAASSTIEGTGLGLALSKGLVVAMGGTLEAESAVGQGSTFTIELPLADGSRTLPEAPGERHTVVLCIAANPAIRRLVELVLAQHPTVTLLTATHGSAGLELAVQSEPDLILLEADLPDMSGYDVLVRLQHSDLTCSLPVIVIGADATLSKQQACIDAGAHAYLSVPFDVAAFRRLLEAVLPDPAAPRPASS